ncbi:hypothetical protein AVEN_119028-1 [Araneus ventricosus]|uniref:RNase H type-1 domain-containing protein n=1 Tax=Araneus ventricosus TaxID=182803 RepID=A0A4Y2FGB6_ARAVE|nr:hypothetical protein AVEN_119028-1 [Araneus ventricosus]
MVFPKTLCDDISSSDYGATDKASFSLSFSFLCLATAITGLAFILLVVAVEFSWPWKNLTYNSTNSLSHSGTSHTPMHGTSSLQRPCMDLEQAKDLNSRFNSDVELPNSVSVAVTAIREMFSTFVVAELEAINFAAGWALERNVKIKVFSDSKSSIEAIRSPKVKSNFVLSVKDNLYNAKDLVSLVWVKAHAGNPGNELAHFEKLLLLVGPICLYLLLILM